MFTSSIDVIFCIYFCRCSVRNIRSLVIMLKVCRRTYIQLKSNMLENLLLKSSWFGCNEENTAKSKFSVIFIRWIKCIQVLWTGWTLSLFLFLSLVAIKLKAIVSKHQPFQFKSNGCSTQDRCYKLTTTATKLFNCHKKSKVETIAFNSYFTTLHAFVLSSQSPCNSKV